jgi:HTH-type transcriptional regulator, competence development regulator
MRSQFGKRVRDLREQQNLFLRQVAPLLEMDTAQLSRIENGSRQLRREQLPLLANILNVELEELVTLWIADQIISITYRESVALNAMIVAKEEITKIQNLSHGNK